MSGIAIKTKKVDVSNTGMKKFDSLNTRKAESGVSSKPDALDGLLREIFSCLNMNIMKRKSSLSVLL